jgi:chromosome partitioning protein
MLLAVAGLKGGTGKTTLAVSLASAVSERGRPALLLDADPLADARHFALLAGASAPPCLALPPDATPADLRALALGLDLCAVDLPAGDPARLSSVLDAADFCLVPCGPSALDVWSLGSTFDRVRSARAHNPALVAAVVINRGNTSTTLGRVVAPQLREAGFPVLATIVHQRVALVEAVGAGLSVTRALPDGHAAAEIEGVLDELAALAAAHAGASAHPV